MRSPVYLESKRCGHDTKWCRESFGTGRWCVRGEIKSAVFRRRSTAWRNGATVPVWRWGLLHPSAKKPGNWQFTTFDDCGPTGDTERATAELALRNGTEPGYLDGWGGHQWHLRGVVLADGSTMGRPELPEFGCGDPGCIVCCPTVFRCKWCNGPVGVDGLGRTYGETDGHGRPQYPGFDSAACAARG